MQQMHPAVSAHTGGGERDYCAGSWVPGRLSAADGHPGGQPGAGDCLLDGRAIPALEAEPGRCGRLHPGGQARPCRPSGKMSLSGCLSAT